MIDALNDYVFEKSVRFPNRDGSFSLGRIDLYKRGFFVLEAKPGANDGDAKLGHGIRGSEGWDQSMVRAKNQAEKYVRALPAAEGRPPFLLVADVGHAIEIYSEFTRTGGIYIPFPDASCHRILEKGEWVDIAPGDAILTGNGASHSVENTGTEPLVIAAIIMLY